MDYIKLINEIKENYIDLLSDKEKDMLDKMLYLLNSSKNSNVGINIKQYINLLVNKIWNKTLTNRYDFKDGKEFCFLLQQYDFYPEEEWAIPQIFVMLVTQDNIKKLQLESIGRILRPNFRENGSVPILPIHFVNGVSTNSKVEYDVVSYYSLNPKFKDVSATTSLLFEKQKEEYDDILFIDKIKYNGNKLERSDVYTITADYIGYYLEKNNLDINLLPNLRDLILKKYLNKLEELYTNYVLKKIKKEELDTLVFKIIENANISLTNNKIK